MSPQIYFVIFLEKRGLIVFNFVQPISTPAGTTPSLKRTQEETGFDNSIPVKRAAVHGIEGSLVQIGGPYMGQNESITELYPVPENTVGLVIGRGGSEIQNIQSQTGCRVQMCPDADNSGFRQVTLQGFKINIDKAKLLIDDVVSRAQQRQQQNQEMFKNENGNITVDVSIPATKCGLIIGKQGETIRLLQEQSGCKMQMIQDTQEVTGLSKPLRICGEPMKIEYAKQLVAEVLKKEAEPGVVRENLNASAKGEVVVPRTSVGMIIGKGGETIKRLANESGTKIQFKPDDDPTSPERCAVIMGTREQIYRATELITDLVNKSNNQMSQTQEVFYMHIPTNKTGLVIGKGGETIKQINAESGAHCELSRDPPPNQQEKVFIIRGTQQQINHAQHIIRIKVGDIPPNTPVPLVSGGVSVGGSNVQPQSVVNGGGAVGSFPTTGGNQYNGGQYGAPQPIQPQQQAPQPQQWGQYGPGGAGMPVAAAIGGQPVNTPSQYMIQQQQTPYQATGGVPAPVQAQPQVAVQQQPGQQPNQPTINPATGQPDYSAQWAEYYRSIGLHSQAAMVESQMKQNAAARTAPTAVPQPTPNPQQYAQYPAGVVGGAYQQNGQYPSQVPAQPY